MNKEEARQIALSEIKKMEESSNSMGSALPGYESKEKIELVVVDELTRDLDFGWVFFYDNRKYIETEDVAYAVGGNAPLIIDRNDGSIHVAGTANSVDFYIEEFQKMKTQSSRQDHH